MSLAILVSSIVLSLSSLVAFTLRDWLALVGRSLLDILPSRARLEIKQYEGRWGGPNAYYDAMNWFISSKAGDYDARSMTLLRTRESFFDVLMPIRNSTCKLRLTMPSSESSSESTTCIRFAFREREEGTGTSSCIVRSIELSADDFGRTTPRELLKVACHAKRLYVEKAQLELWRSQVFTLKDKAWSGAPLRNTRTWGNVVLESRVKARLKDDLAQFLESENYYQARGVAWTRGYLLSGPPGTGKSSVVKAMSNEARLDIYIMRLSAIKSDDDLERAFASLPNRCLLLLEDIDCTGEIVRKRDEEPPRPKADAGKIDGVTLSCLLNLLDGVVSGHGRVVVMTTNHAEQLDPAMLRPGRCDVHAELTYCTAQQANDIYRIYFDADLPPASTEALASAATKRVAPAAACGACLQHRNDAEAAAEAIRALFENAIPAS